MTAADAHMVKFQCPKYGHELEQTIGNLKLSEHMRCPGCGVGIDIDTNRLANATTLPRKYKERLTKFLRRSPLNSFARVENLGR
jgi:hypothetical protein